MLILFVKVMVLIGVLRLLISWEKPVACAGIYTGVDVVLNLAGGASGVATAITAAITFVYCFCWFWLLDRVEEGLIWWSIVVGGILLPIAAVVALR